MQQEEQKMLLTGGTELENIRAKKKQLQYKVDNMEKIDLSLYEEVRNTNASTKLNNIFCA